MGQTIMGMPLVSFLVVTGVPAGIVIALFIWGLTFPAGNREKGDGGGTSGENGRKG